MTDLTVERVEAPATLPEGAVPDQAYLEQMRSVQHQDAVDPKVAAAAAAAAGKARPDHIPEQFWDTDKGEAKWDDLARSYAELSAQKPAEQEVPKEEAPKADGEVNPLSAAVTDFATLYEKGEVNDEAIDKLAELGLPKETIQTYLAGLEALAAQNTSAAAKIAGGEAQLKAAMEWAAQTLSEDDLNFYNNGVQNAATRDQAVEWLAAKYRAARPPEGRLLTNTTAPTASTGDLFHNQTQVSQAMTDPRYSIDPEYRQSVAAKLLRSRQAGSFNGTASLHSR